MANWFSKAHGFDVAPNEVMVSAGAKQVIFNAFHAVLDEGDEVILPAPYWVSYSEIAKLAGAKPVPVVSRAEDEFVVNPDLVAKAITPRTRMLLIVSPCNPTGAVYDEKTLRALADLAVKHDLWLLTDDIYRSLIYGDAKFVQPASFGPEVKKRTIIADGVSKTFAMTGWRVGFAMAPPPVIEAMDTLQGQSTTNAAAVSQAAALAAIEGPTDEIEKMRQAFDSRRKYMVQALRAIPGVKCVEPKGAFYAFPDLSAFNGKTDARGQGHRRRPVAVRLPDRGGQGGGGARLGVLRARVRAPVVRHVPGQHRKRRGPHGRGPGEAQVVLEVLVGSPAGPRWVWLTAPRLALSAWSRCRRAAGRRRPRWPSPGAWPPIPAGRPRSWTRPPWGRRWPTRLTALPRTWTPWRRWSPPTRRRRRSS